MLRHGFATIKCRLKTPTIVAAWRYPNIYGTLRKRKPIMKLWPRPHYIVLKRKPYCFVPFSKRFASTLRFRIVFPVHTTTRIRIENAFKPYILLYYPSILPVLLSLQQIKVVPLRWSSSWSCPESSRFERASTESFLLSSFHPKLAD